MSQTVGRFRTEFAIDGAWYTNALRFDRAEDAIAEAEGRYRVWTMPAAWRVVTDDTPQKQPYLGWEDNTASKVTDKDGVEVTDG